MQTARLVAVPEGWTLVDLDGHVCFAAYGRDARHCCLSEACRLGVLCLAP